MFWYGITAVALAIILRFTGTRVIGIYTLESPQAYLSGSGQELFIEGKKKAPKDLLSPFYYLFIITIEEQYLSHNML